MADVVEMPVMNSKLHHRCQDVMDKIKEREFTSFAIIAVDKEGHVITAYDCDDNYFAMIGALEVVKKELIEL